MTEHTPTPWRVFTTKDGRKLVGIGSQEGEAILDCGFGVWSWDDPAGIANAELVVKAVNSYEAMVKALQKIADLVESEAGEPLDDAIKIANDALASVGNAREGS